MARITWISHLNNFQLILKLRYGKPFFFLNFKSIKKDVFHAFLSIYTPRRKSKQLEIRCVPKYLVASKWLIIVCKIAELKVIRVVVN